MLDEIPDQNKALGLIYQSIIKSHTPTTMERKARMLDILVAVEVHGVRKSQLAGEYGISRGRVGQIHAYALRVCRGILKYHKCC